MHAPTSTSRVQVCARTPNGLNNNNIIYSTCTVPVRVLVPVLRVIVPYRTSTNRTLISDLNIICTNNIYRLSTVHTVTVLFACLHTCYRIFSKLPLFTISTVPQLDNHNRSPSADATL